MTTNISNNSREGFTLVETLVAIAILLIAVVGPISLIGNAIHNLYYAKDEMIAINLAQEGIEVVRQKRDSNLLSNTAWDTGFAPVAGGAVKDYIVDATTGTLTACTIVTPCGVTQTPVYLDTTTGFYKQASTPPVGPIKTQFSRRISVSGIGNERAVTTTVIWKTGGTNGTVSVSENIFKWTP
ncbi:MAG: prepilin-type N-terminal cleavage/methylation domain-containing protein [Minisyncoccia bacterium]